MDSVYLSTWLDFNLDFWPPFDLKQLNDRSTLLMYSNFSTGFIQIYSNVMKNMMFTIRTFNRKTILKNVLFKHYEM